MKSGSCNHVQNHMTFRSHVFEIENFVFDQKIDFYIGATSTFTPLLLVAFTTSLVEAI